MVTELGGECCGAEAEPQDIGISMNAGFKIIANVNSHQFLPNFQNPATIIQDIFLMEPNYKRFIVCTHTVNPQREDIHLCFTLIFHGHSQHIEV